jgi:hypothetical protein
VAGVGNGSFECIHGRVMILSLNKIV